MTWKPTAGKNAAAVKRSVFPAYQDLMDGILALRDTGKIPAVCAIFQKEKPTMRSWLLWRPAQTGRFQSFRH